MRIFIIYWILDSVSLSRIWTLYALSFRIMTNQQIQPVQFSNEIPTLKFETILNQDYFCRLILGRSKVAYLDQILVNLEKVTMGNTYGC